MRRKIMIYTVLVCMVITLMPADCMAVQKEINVYIDGRPISFDAAPVIEDNRTLVPMRAIFEALGKKVDWISESRTAVIYDDAETRTELQADNPVATSYSLGSNGTEVSDIRQTPIDVPAKIINDRMMVPLRFISEMYGYDVDWDGYYRNVYIGDCNALRMELNRQEQINQVTVYAPDGRTKLIKEREVNAYVKVGWFKTEAEAKSAAIFAARSKLTGGTWYCSTDVDWYGYVVSFLTEWNFKADGTYSWTHNRCIGGYTQKGSGTYTLTPSSRSSSEWILSINGRISENDNGIKASEKDEAKFVVWFTDDGLMKMYCILGEYFTDCNANKPMVTSHTKWDYRAVRTIYY